MRYLRACKAAGGGGKKTHGLYLKAITAAGILGHFAAAHSHMNLFKESIRSLADELIDQLRIRRRRRSRRATSTTVFNVLSGHTSVGDFLLKV